MSDVSNIEEATQVIQNAKEAVQEASTALEGAKDFLEQMIAVLADRGLPVDTKQAALEALEEYITEIDGVISAADDVTGQIAALGG